MFVLGTYFLSNAEVLVFPLLQNGETRGDQWETKEKSGETKEKSGEINEK